MKTKPKPSTKKREKVLILRTCSKDLTSHNGFKWPTKGQVEAPDWDLKPECGNGLHGLLWGEGDGSLLNWAADAKWLVVEADASKVVDLKGKVKVPSCKVVYCGDCDGAVSYIKERAPAGKAIVGAKETAGYKGQATAGYKGQATAGYKGQATAGDGGQATAGYKGQATAGYKGQATAGYKGQATAGNYGQATAGNYGQATAGDGGQATAGLEGTLILRWWDGKRYRTAVFYVGEDGIEANVAYRCENGKAIKVEK